jgi:hypothetical protein
VTWHVRHGSCALPLPGITRSTGDLRAAARRHITGGRGMRTLQPRWRSTNKLRPVTQRFAGPRYQPATSQTVLLLLLSPRFVIYSDSGYFCPHSQPVRRKRRPASFPQSLRRCERATPLCDSRCRSLSQNDWQRHAAPSCRSARERGELSPAMRVQSGTCRALPGEYLPTGTDSVEYI